MSPASDASPPFNSPDSMDDPRDSRDPIPWIRWTGLLSLVLCIGLLLMGARFWLSLIASCWTFTTGYFAWVARARKRYLVFVSLGLAISLVWVVKALEGGHIVQRDSTPVAVVTLAIWLSASSTAAVCYWQYWRHGEG